MTRAITSLDQVTAFPLCWPPDKERCPERRPTPFKVSMARAQREIEEELPRWGAGRWIVSMAPQYRQGAVDPGVAVWFEIPGREIYELRVLACDNFMLREANLHAIALTLDRLRSMERYGTYSLWQALEGARPMLPPPGEAAQREWWKVLGVARDYPLPAVEGMYRALAKEAAGDESRMRDLNLAIEAARKELAP